MTVFHRIKHKTHSVFLNRTRKALTPLSRAFFLNSPVSLIGRTNPNKLTKLQFYANILVDQRPVLVPIERLRSWRIFPTKSTVHPYFFALKRLSASSTNIRKQLKDDLREYYDRVTDLNAAEWLGLPIESFWAGQISWAHALPWELDDANYRRYTIASTMLHDSRAHGTPLTIDEGWYHVGPVSEQVLTLEVDRLACLVESLTHTPYTIKPLGKNVGGIVLFDERNNDWCIIVSPGQHRTVVAASMDISKVPVELRFIIRRSDAPYWPQVQRGTYTVDEALNVFDRIMEGRLPPAFDPWVEYVRQNAPETE